MGVKATRPFVPTASRRSALTIKNLNDYLVCGANWLAYSGENVVLASGCDMLSVDLPVPEPEPEEEPVEEPVEKDTDEDEKEMEDEETNATGLTIGAFAAIGLMAMTF